MTGTGGQTSSVKYSQIVSWFEQGEVADFTLNLKNGEMSLTLSEAATQELYDAQAAAQQQAASQPSGSLSSLFGGTGSQQQAQQPKRQSLIYVVPATSIFLQSLPDYVAAHDAKYPDSPMTYDVLPAGQTSIWVSMLPMLIITVVVMGAFYYFVYAQGGGGKAMSVGRAKVKDQADQGRKATFADVAGADEEKEELAEIVEFLKNQQRFNTLGARIPHGVLLVGPPGTGKTLLARACAGEAGVPFYSISGSDFVEMYVGVGASRVRDLFEKAKKTAPCIVFIDEIDAVGRQRGTGLGGGHDEREQTLNQLLVEMDGFAANEGVIVIAATNRADILDKALLRPGRFDRQVYVGLPDIKGREEILRVHTRNKPLGPDVVLKTIAKSTAGFTGADLENLVNEAALLAAKRGRKAITEQDIEEASIKVIAGPEKRSRVVTDKDKRITAYHEAGHAIVSYFCKTADPVHEISIIPRGMAAGYTLNLPEDDRSHLTKAKMSEQIVVLLGGRVAEKLVLDDVSTGASNDLERATDTARSMVTRYGFSERLGPVVYGSDPHETFLGRDFSSGRGYSEQVAAEIDGEIRDMLDEAYETARRILSEHMQQLHTVAGALIEREKLTGAEFQTLMQGGTLPPADAPRAKVKPVPVGTQPVQQTPAAKGPEAAEGGQAPAQAEAAVPVQENGAAQQPDAPGGAQQDAPQ
ncbi:MAG: ATP-dependent zinc metalloprotease FtsH [Ruthenibacterium sp.]